MGTKSTRRVCKDPKKQRISGEVPKDKCSDFFLRMWDGNQDYFVFDGRFCLLGVFL